MIILRDLRCLCILLWLALWMGGCASWAVASDKLPRDSRIGVTVTRFGGRFQIRVLVAPRCPPVDEGPCPEGKPMSDLTLAVRTPTGDRVLGKTWVDGTLVVSFTQIEALFAGEATIDKDKSAPLLVEGRSVADLPVGELGSRRRIIEAAILECDQALADPNLQADYAQQLLGRMLDLQLLGLADDRLSERTTRLAERVRAERSSMWSAPKPMSERGVTSGMRATGAWQRVPSEVRRELARQDPDDGFASASFRWALESLPTLCKITVKGGELLAQVVVTGAPAIALAIIEASVGEVYGDWMVDTCCQKGSELLGADQPPQCAKPPG